jgi:hypothetical protein
VVALTSINSIAQPDSATLNGIAKVGSGAVPATAWIEYGTDPSLATYTQSVPWPFTGNNSFSLSLTELNAATTYAVRLAVQTPGGTGKSIIRLFTTIADPPSVALAIATGASNVATVSAGQTATYMLLASNRGNGYTGTATLICWGVPTAATCTVSTPMVNIGVNATPFTVTITTTAPLTAFQRSDSSDLVLAFGLLLGTGILAFGMKRHSLNLLICLAVMMMFALACGGSGSPSGAGVAPTPPPATPSGTYSVTIEATTEEVQTSQLLTLIVK